MDTIFRSKKTRPSASSTTSAGTPYSQISSGPAPIAGPSSYRRDVITPNSFYDGMPPPSGRPRDSDAVSIRSMASSTSMLPNNDLGRYPSFSDNRRPDASTRPSDADIEAEFQRLLDERELLNPRSVPSISSRQSVSSVTDVSKSTASLTVDQKWQMVKADAQARQTRSDEKKSGVVKNSPEWFLRKILDNSVTVQHMSTLFVSLRTMPLE
jgi:cytokinesis protein